MSAPLALLAAASMWSAPATISERHQFIAQPGVAVTGDGTAIASWGWQDGRHIATAETGSAYALRPSGGAFGAEVAVPGSASGAPVTFGQRAFALLTATPYGRGGSSTRLAVAIGATNTGLGRPRTIARGLNLLQPRLAGNASGHLALVWLHRRGGNRDRLYVAIRRPKLAFSRPRVLAEGRLRSVSAAVGPRGDVLVAWSTRGRVRVRLKLHRARRWRPAQTIRSLISYSAELKTAIDGGGRGYVAWLSQLVTEGGNTGPIYAQAAVHPSGARGFKRAQLLERLGADKGRRGIGLALGPEPRTARVVWMGHDGSRYLLRSATAGGDGVFGGRVDVPGGADDLGVSDLVSGPGGALAILTRTLPDQRTQVVGSLAPPNGGFGVPEPISAEERAYDGRAAFDPLTGAPLALWANGGAVEVSGR